MGRRKTEHGRGGYALYPVGLGKLKKLRSSQNDEDCAKVIYSNVVTANEKSLLYFTPYIYSHFLQILSSKQAVPQNVRKGDRYESYRNCTKDR